MRTFITFCASFVAATLLGQQPLELRDGLVIDPAIQTAYVMSAEGGISAIDLKMGQIRWHTKAADKPLVLVRQRLLGQIEPKSTARLHFLDVASLETQGGALVKKAAAELKPPAQASVGETLSGTLKVDAEAVADNKAIITYSYLPAPREEMQARPPRQKQSDAMQRVTEAVSMDVGSGKITSAAVAPHQQQQSNGWVVASAAGTEPNGWRTFQSADGRYLLASRRLKEATSWEKYVWRVTEQKSGQLVGEIRSHLAFAPFVVRDSTIVFETTPFQRGTQEPEPAKLRGIDLKNGKEVWAVPVRETVRRAPPPP